MKVIKRNGSEVDFDSNKILVAITKANAEIDSIDKLSTNEINTVVYSISEQINKSTRAVTVEEIQDIIEDNLMRIRAYKVARAYIRYRYDREKARNRNTTDDAIMTLIEYENEEVKQENSNKNPTINSTQRDYMACSYSCTTKARDDKDAVRMEFIQQDRELASSIAEREKEKDIVKREHAVKPEYGFNEFRKKPEHGNAETKEERDMNKDNGKKTLDGNRVGFREGNEV